MSQKERKKFLDLSFFFFFSDLHQKLVWSILGCNPSSVQIFLQIYSVVFVYSC